MKKQLLLLVMMLLPMVASADAVEIDGIYYDLITKAKVAEVTNNPNKYTGSVVIPETVNYDNVTYSVTSIGDYAFSNCKGLTSVIIGNSVTRIGRGAFSSCSGLTSINIPNSVTSIGNYAFLNCTGLTSVTIGSGIKSIGSGAFAKCSDLTDVFCYARNVPKTNSDAFSKSYIEYATLHIPAVSVNLYKAAVPWKNFKEIVALTDSDPKPDATKVNVVRNTEDNKTIIYDLNGVRQNEAKKGINIVNGKKYVMK